ncbi:DUF4926 domain-containing protein [Methylocystis bryophila]|uniref:DUF4926 domain-containing protein n=1 Tax=Methylocystis bryophila TaxID=655015 RepID=A0A1W6MX59_9HYPH|nr:DUF4926 domain-containing protein [Methylocystis bryophila]ARN82178.1 hypothetical protein B1812_15015 [Methylocystis bryophila]BDV38311.1 hypothetical protein DSM21852_15640 [Methylocystis bryophila]
MLLSLYESVVLAVDLPEKGLKAGTRGAIIDVHEQPTAAYEVEFFDADGNTIDWFTVTPEQVQLALGTVKH